MIWKLEDTRYIRDFSEISETSKLLYLIESHTLSRCGIFYTRNYGLRQHRDLSVESAAMASPQIHQKFPEQFQHSKTFIYLVESVSKVTSLVEYLPTHQGHINKGLFTQAVFISQKPQRCLFCAEHRCIAIF
jgi:hypothetical protein